MLADVGHGQWFVDFAFHKSDDPVKQFFLVVLAYHAGRLRNWHNIGTLKQTNDGFCQQAVHQTVRIGSTGRTFLNQCFDQRVCLFGIREYPIDENIVPVIREVRGDVFHVEHDCYIRNSLVVRVLGVKLTRTVDNHIFFAQRVGYAVHLGMQNTCIYISQFEELVPLTLEVITGRSDTVVIAQNVLNADTGENGTEFIGGRKRKNIQLVIVLGI